MPAKVEGEINKVREQDTCRSGDHIVTIGSNDNQRYM